MAELKHYISDKNHVSWAESSNLAQWVESMLRQGRDDEVLPLMRMLPPQKVPEYRQLWARIKSEMKHDLPPPPENPGPDQDDQFPVFDALESQIQDDQPN